MDCWTRWELSVTVDLLRSHAPSNSPEAAAVAELLGTAQRRERLYENLPLSVAPGEIVAVVGPSGAGKSLLLAQIARICPDALSVDRPAVTADNRPAVACLDDGERGLRLLERLCVGTAPPAARADVGLAERLEVLSRCGLAEAGALLTPARLLSGGQAYRLALAWAVWRAAASGRPRLLLIDEFAAALDKPTATALARQLGKLARRYLFGAIVATPRPDLVAALDPSAVLAKPLGEPARIVRPPRGSARPQRWRVTRGCMDDYRALARFHYVGGPLPVHKRIWTIRTPRGDRTAGGPEVAAVLVVSHPLRLCQGRNVAFPGRYVGPDHAAAVRRLNAEIERISRVVVHPVYRGCGLAVRLVRHAIRRAGAPHVEALAAMGAVHPFFELAGMKPFGHFGQGRGYRYYLARATGWLNA